MVANAAVAGTYFGRPRPQWPKIGVSMESRPDMTDKIKPAFDPKEFLAQVGEGKTILEFRKDSIVFAQGDAANTVFYILKGRVKVIVVSEQGKEAVVGIL